MADQPAPAPSALPPACEPLFVTILALQSGGAFGEPDALQQTFAERFGDLQQRAAAAGVAPAATRQAQFALAAFADEVVGRSTWPGRVDWALLQFQFFQTHRAGVEFFDQLQPLRTPWSPAVWLDPARAGPLEVFALCLLLGFRGAWSFSPPAQLSADLATLVGQAAAKPLPPLAPDARPQPYQDPLAPELTRWRWGFVVLYIVLAVTLGLLGWFWRSL